MAQNMSLPPARPIVIRNGVAVLREALSARALPRPHAPDDRVLLAYFDDWELRDFAPGSNFTRFFARHALTHRQLFQRERALSILTPSALTEHRFELCSSGDGPIRFVDERSLRAYLARRYDASLPAGRSLRALGRWR
jgi:hypothetical protein